MEKHYKVRRDNLGGGVNANLLTIDITIVAFCMPWDVADYKPRLSQKEAEAKISASSEGSTNEVLHAR